MPSPIEQSDAVEEVSLKTIHDPSELPQFLGRIAQYPDEFIIYDDGFRGRTFGYAGIAGLVWALAARLRVEGLRRGDVAMIWSESRPGWIVALWACLLEGIIVVPVEPQSSVDLFRKIEQKVRPRLILLGERVPVVTPNACIPTWRLAEIERSTGHAPSEQAALSGGDVAEIVFTSGTTGEPKGVVITHRNLAAQFRPIEDQIAPYRKYVRPFAPLRILNLLPMSHLFGQLLVS
jgi:long-chain acyl-CoA synthetase